MCPLFYINNYKNIRYIYNSIIKNSEVQYQIIIAILVVLSIAVIMILSAILKQDVCSKVVGWLEQPLVEDIIGFFYNRRNINEKEFIRRIRTISYRQYVK